MDYWRSKPRNRVCCLISELFVHVCNAILLMTKTTVCVDRVKKEFRVQGSKGEKKRTPRQNTKKKWAPPKNDGLPRKMMGSPESHSH